MNIECQICFNKIKINYKSSILPCNHSICNLCLYFSIYELISSSKEIGGNDYFNCLKCDMNSNISICDFLKTIKYLSKNEKLCDCCNQEKIDCFCYNCKIFFSEKCLKEKHNKLKCFQDHIITKNYLCYNNCERIYKVYCSTCDEFVCEICCLLFHLRHSLMNFSHKENNINEIKIKKEIQNFIICNFDYNQVIDIIENLIKYNKSLISDISINSQAIDLSEKLKLLINIGSSKIIKFLKKKSEKIILNILSQIEIIKRQFTRLKLQQKSLVKLIINKEHNFFFNKKIDLLYNCKFVSYFNIMNQHALINIMNELSILKYFLNEDKKYSIMNGKLVNEDNIIKTFTQKAEIIVTNKILNEVYPNMIIAFQKKDGDCYVGYISNLKFSIELIKITKIENFKSFNILDDIQIKTKDKSKYLFSIKAHSDSINGLFQYKFEKDNYMITFSNDKKLKLWSCENFTEVISFTHEQSIKSACLLTYESIRYFIIGSFLKDYPLSVYSFSGVYLKCINVRGYIYHIDSYSSSNITYIFVSTFNPFNLYIYDFNSEEKLYIIQTTSYINNLLVSHNESLLLIYIDRNGLLGRFDLTNGISLAQIDGFGNFSIIKWNEIYFIFSKDNGFFIMNILSQEIISEYKHINHGLIKGLCKFHHHTYGEILFTIGKDQRIFVLK